MTEDDVIRFIYAEARILDERRFNDWLDLFTEDGRYWIPAEWQQTDPLMQPSLMYEDKFFLTVRVERLSGARTFSQKPSSRSAHVLQPPQVDEMGEAIRTWTPFHYAETRGDDSFSLDGWMKHELCVQDGELKIRLKRVELLQFDQPLPSIQLFI